jgi:hypothetical protein
MNFFEKLVLAREHNRFQMLLKTGLRARDVVPVRIFGEKKERLALLCVNGEKVFAVICTNTNRKADSTSIFTLLGHYLQAKNGIVLGSKSDWVELSGNYYGLKAPLVVAEDVSIRKVGNDAG